ncbi:MAG: dienelactone hydrolase family protein [Acidimicrobiia bacterium]
MATIAVFHSVLGVKPGLLEAADMLRSHRHTVHVIDQYNGRVFDDYDPAMEHMEGIGFGALMASALAAGGELPPGFVTLGFSNGAGMAQYVAAKVPAVAGAVMSGGAIDPGYLEITWPQGIPAQIHTTVDDPWREQDAIEAAAAAVAAAGGAIEVFDYPGAGHLFADASKPDEYQPEEAELMWSRVLDFLSRIDG